MEIELTDDQRLFVDTTRRFLESEAPLTRTRELSDDPVGFDRDYWQRGAQLGWTAALVPEDLGGGSVSGGGLLDLVLVAEEFGRLVAPGPLLPVNVVASALARAGAPGAHRGVLDGLLDGRTVASWAFGEGDRRWDASGVQAEATREGDGWLVNGRKAYVQDLGAAEWVLVVVRTGAGLTQLLVSTASEGVAVEPLVSLDMTRRFAHLTLDGVHVPDDAVVGEVGGAGPEIEHQLQVALSLQCAESAGAAARMFDATLEYSTDRISFGRPIGSYQALKHRMADMKLWLEASLAIAGAAARSVAIEDPRAAETVSVAKAYIGDRAPALVQDCVQLHGGIGVTWDADLHLYLRRVAQNAAMLGTVAQHRDRLAAMLGV